MPDNYFMLEEPHGCVYDEEGYYYEFNEGNDYYHDEGN